MQKWAGRFSVWFVREEIFLNVTRKVISKFAAPTKSAKLKERISQIESRFE